MNEVAAMIPSKWQDIGLQLGLDPGVLQEIDINTWGIPTMHTLQFSIHGRDRI